MSAAPLLSHARKVNGPTLFLPGFVPPETPGSFEALVARALALAGGQALAFNPGRAAYPDFDDFWAISVRAGGAWVGAVADRWADEGDMLAALAVLRRAAA